MKTVISWTFQNTITVFLMVMVVSVVFGFSGSLIKSLMKNKGSKDAP